MALKSQTIAQFEGFGNLKPKSQGEYFRGNGVSRGANGLAFNKYSYEQKSDQNASIPATLFAYAKGLGGLSFNTNVVGDYLYMRCASNNLIFQSYQGSFAPEEIFYLGMNFVLNGSLIGDPKGRLIACGERYLAVCDTTTANYRTGTIQVTNGSNAVVGTGTTFTPAMVGKKLRVDGDYGTTAYYTIATYTDATHIILGSNYAGTSGSGKAYTIYTSWTEQWKDFGTSVVQTSSGTIIPMVMENYESTVLIGRGNNICTLDVTTDTITTDASPSFSMPSGYYCQKISANRAGIIMWFDSYEGSTLVLWDNYSIRSVAPWIKLKDQVLDVMKYGSGWIVVTKRSVYYTDGFGLQLLVPSFLDSEITTLGSFKGEIVNDLMFFTTTYGNTPKSKDGLYCMNLKNGLIENYGTSDFTSYGNSFYQVFNIPLQNSIVFSTGSKLCRLARDAMIPSKVCSYLSNPVAKSGTNKVAKKLNVPITISETYYSAYTEGFKISAYINPMTRQNSFLCFPQSASTVYNQIKFTTANFPAMQVGESIEFLNGANAGQIRNITAVSTASGITTVTLDSALSNLPQTTDRIEYSPFQFIKSYTVSQAQAVEMKSLVFTIQNEIKGKAFQIKLVVENASVPIEVMPMDFIYDDLGVI